MKNRRAQAAIEFLTTYGWALLVIAIVLVALGWLGVFSPQNIIQEYCQFPVGTFECNDVFVYNDVYTAPGYFTDQYSALQFPLLEVTNNFGKDVYICHVLCSAAPADPATGTPALSGIPEQDGGFTACGGAAYARFKAGERKNIRTVDYWPCLGKEDNYWHWGVKAGDMYDGKIYIFYSYEGETTGRPRLIVGDLRTKIQPPPSS